MRWIPKRRRPAGVLLAWFLLLLLPACAARPSRPPDVGPVQTPEEILHIVAARAEGLRDLEASARLTLHIEGVRQRASASCLYRAPGAFKLDVTGPLGSDILFALARDDSLAVYLPQDNRYIKGPAAAVLYRITGVNLEYYDARRAILGLPSLSRLDLPRIARFEAGQGHCFLELHDPLWTRHVWLDRRTLTVQEERIFSPGGGLLSRRVMDGYRDENGVVLPRLITILQGDDLIRIEITRRRVNIGLSDERFRMKIPSDAIPLSGQDGIGYKKARRASR